MKIMVVSDAVYHQTGYGVQTRLLCQRLLKDGHEVLNYAPGALYYGSFTVDGVKVLSANSGDDRWGNASLQYHLARHAPDLVITWLDPQGLTNYALDPTPVFMWAPIDTWPIPEQEQGILARAENLMVPSRWGQDLLDEHGFDSDYLPCGIDTSVFYPDPKGAEEFRAAYGIGDAFLIGMVGLNAGSPDRKGYGFAFDVIKQFVDEHQGLNVKAYIHCGTPNGSMGAIDLYAQRKQLGLEDVVIFPPDMGPEGYPEQYLRHAYSAFDVLLHTGMTEGFGVPVVEAQACGTPVVANACTSVTELLAPGSIGVKYRMDMPVATNTRIAIPDVWELARRLHVVCQSPRAIDPEWVSRFEFEHVYETYWKPVLAKVPQKLEIEKGRKLLLGCGNQQKEGFVHHDIEKFHPHIDVAHDLTKFPYPWADNSWDYIEMSDVMEHLRGDVTTVMDELWRVTAPGGHVFIHTCEAGSWQHSMDPTHVHGFNLNSFDYYDPETRYGTQYKYTEKGWKLVKKGRDPSGGLIYVLTPRKVGAVEEVA